MLKYRHRFWSVETWQNKCNIRIVCVTKSKKYNCTMVQCYSFISSFFPIFTTFPSSMLFFLTFILYLSSAFMLVFNSMCLNLTIDSNSATGNNHYLLGVTECPETSDTSSSTLIHIFLFSFLPILVS